MTPLQSADDAIQRIRDTLADSSKIREGLQDPDAIPFIDWGDRLAHHLGANLAGTADEQVDNAAYNLARLMTRLNWLVTYRHKKDAAWLAKTFQMANKLSQDIYGENAPALSDEAVAAWIADHANHDDSALIQDLMARFTPPALADSAPPADVPDTPDSTGEAATPPAPLSDSVFGPKTPGESNG